LDPALIHIFLQIILMYCEGVKACESESKWTQGTAVNAKRGILMKTVSKKGYSDRTLLLSQIHCSL
jgi:hypothetical protein